jgi:hypothetical protein
LHGSTEVTVEDEILASAAGLALIDEAGKRLFRQPCPKFACGMCTVYDERPTVCRTYSCKLLDDVQAGRLSESEAREKIAITKKLASAIFSFAPAATPAQRSGLSKRLQASLGEISGREREQAARALLSIAALEHMLDRWFRYDSKESAGPGDRESSPAAG